MLAGSRGAGSICSLGAVVRVRKANNRAIGKIARTDSFEATATQPSSVSSSTVLEPSLRSARFLPQSYPVSRTPIKPAMP
jgi:hypothetical protein